MTRNIFICAPHADDELLGIGGTLLKHLEAGDNLFIAFITHPKSKFGYDTAVDQSRRHEIENCMRELGVSRENFRILGYRPASLDYSCLEQLIVDLKELINSFMAHTIYIPNSDDIHSDHYFVAKAIDAIGKSFRSTCIRKIISYETISETDISVLIHSNYKPNLYVNIESYIQKKLSLLQNYESEMGVAPFPRSPKIIKAHAMWRGSQAGYKYAEAHRVLVDRKD